MDGGSLSLADNVAAPWGGVRCDRAGADEGQARAGCRGWVVRGAAAWSARPFGADCGGIMEGTERDLGSAWLVLQLLAPAFPMFGGPKPCQTSRGLAADSAH
jgi:hypothetical protein